MYRYFFCHRHPRCRIIITNRRARKRKIERTTMGWVRFLVLLFPLSKRRRREKECTLVSRHVCMFKLLICLSTNDNNENLSFLLLMLMLVRRVKYFTTSIRSDVLSSSFILSFSLIESGGK